MRKKKIAVIGTLDTKGEEFAYLVERLTSCGVEAVTIDTGVNGQPGFAAVVSREEVARRGGGSIESLALAADRGAAIDVMMKGAAAVVSELYSADAIDGAIGMGGTAGTTIGAHAMRALPVGFPKLLVSTVASGDTRPYVGEKDVTMMYSVVDISGLNRISKTIMSNAAHAIAGMAMHREESGATEGKPIVAATMFGVTTPCVTEAKHYLESKGYEVLVFHATGTGGRSMESLIESGFVSGVLDITTTEWADELVGGVFRAGPDRLGAAARRGIPQVVSLGALDMVNFGPIDTVPSAFRSRNLYKHNATVTLMRTNVEENARLGEIVSAKLNESAGPCSLFVPLGGVSMIDRPGMPFHGEAEDEALFASIRSGVDRTKVELIEMETHINDPAFALAMAQKLEQLMNGTE